MKKKNYFAATHYTVRQFELYLFDKNRKHLFMSMLRKLIVTRQRRKRKEEKKKTVKKGMLRMLTFFFILVQLPITITM